MEVADNGQLQAKGTSPDIERYLSMWERDPRSRVFAPLAEEYRKVGQLDRSIEICQKGLLIHPHYVSGRVALGRAFFEKGDYDSAKTQLEMVFEAHPGNLVAAKTLGEIYEEEGEYEKALLCYRLANFATPSAIEITEKVKAMEAMLAVKLETGIGLVSVVDERASPDKEIEELTSSLTAARATLRDSEAREAGDLQDDDDEDRESLDDFEYETGRLKSGAKNIDEEEDDEITLEMDLFFAETPTSSTGGYSGFQVRDAKEAVAVKGRQRSKELAKLTLTELMLRQGYVERAIKVYEEYLLSDPESEQGISRVVQLKEQLEDVKYEVRIREGEPGRQVKEEEDRKEVVYTLVDWLHRMKI